ncbi:histone deacetylase family protein [Cognatilysobacter lacus]|uniref:Histone deacetylase family protein n=1 Tax=Cognatilysobacter lacus TaxID=1643323 RepID=A0A5D8YX87_9GAMM|nr:histone deacetylase family protein [Lysobacter lacus]TZF87141.1 histone deacetylase family protein [Lysobacter lacus]
MLLLTHPACAAHTVPAGHAERPERLAAVVDAIRDTYPDLPWAQAPLATRGQLARVHDDALIRQVLDTPVASGHVQLDPDTFLSPGAAEAALRCAGAGVAAVDAVLSGRARRVFCAVRPPGHHATRDTAMGFCFFNSIAVAAAHALDAHGLSRVAIVDFDVHHGNGTQAIFEADARVVFCSSHQLPLYPETGHADERGIGNVYNAPLTPGTSSEGFRRAWSEILLPALDAFAPQLILVSAGFDAHQRDPLAQLDLDAVDYLWITGQLREISRRHCEGRIVSMLEGGYDLQALAESAAAHVGALVADGASW